jgi:hypothetical protein
MFEKNKQYFSIMIHNKVIIGVIKGISLPYIPSDLIAVQNKIMMSRNKLPTWTIELFHISKEEMAEFENAKDDKELMDIVIKDCAKHDCKLIDTKIT